MSDSISDEAGATADFRLAQRKGFNRKFTLLKGASRAGEKLYAFNDN